MRNLFSSQGDPGRTQAFEIPERAGRYPGGPKALGTQEAQGGHAHTDFSAQVMTAAAHSETPFGLENPEPTNEVSLFNMPSIVKAKNLAASTKDVGFDQCRFGGKSRKPTRIMAYRLNLRDLKDKRCDHPMQTFKDEQGREYQAAHERVASRKVKGEEGKEQWASKELATYAPRLCEVLAKAIAQVRTSRARQALAEAMERDA